MHHLNGRKTKDEARGEQQLLTAQEERGLANWISQATAAGNPVPYPYIEKQRNK